MRGHIEEMWVNAKFKKFLDKQVEKIGQDFGLKGVEVYVLLFISTHPDCNTGKKIQEGLNINKGYLSQVMEKLYKDGYIRAEQDAKDRRYIHYFSTETAEPIINKLHENKRRIDARIFEGVTAEEIETMQIIMKKIEVNMQQFLAELDKL